MTVSPREIVGGTFTLPVDLEPSDGAASVTLTVNGTVLTNVATKVYRNALTLDGGAKVDGGSIVLGESSLYAGQLTLKNCLVTNMTAISSIYRGVLTLGNGARWVAPTQRMNLSWQTKWEYTNTVATLNIEEGSDTTIGYLNCGHNGGFLYTNKDSISLGLVATIEHLQEADTTIYQMMYYIPIYHSGLLPQHFSKMSYKGLLH